MDVVRDLVSKAGGRVGIATKPGEYTRFRITLPHEKKASDAAVRREGAPSVLNLARVAKLVADVRVEELALRERLAHRAVGFLGHVVVAIAPAGDEQSSSRRCCGS